jgi:acetyl/propionyl-CoA carboxylase alpha subunit/acetyl-CoA carboxylase carboxyltransferase component|tara:strand:- start:1774 stop:5148 length:3375 start_codon:yes stop_codon:yes gene_type:complete
MKFTGILIANRGEISIRIARAAADIGIRSVAVYSSDDQESLHTKIANEAVLIPGLGASAYLDINQIIQAAQDANCDAIHPGYGFLSERVELAASCAAVGITFIGPTEEHLTLFGDKGAARRAAIDAGVPVLKGTDHPVEIDELTEFFDAVEGSIIIKAVAGGGGRGTRVVHKKADLKEAFARCQSEAEAAFGLRDVYVEEFLARARHIEVQIIGDSMGNITHLGERECSVQRRNQKVVEIAPAPNLPVSLRDKIIRAAVNFAHQQNYLSLGTFEFLVDDSVSDDQFVFIEANARLQVEHTVTEEVTGVDLVRSQIQLAMGSSLIDLGLDSNSPVTMSGFAIQARVNLETINGDGTVMPGAGQITIYEAPNGPGVRTDGFGYVGYTTSTAFDSLLAKVIVHEKSSYFKDVASKMIRAISEFHLEGVRNNISFIKNIISHPDFIHGNIHTRWVEENIAELTAPWDGPDLFVAATETDQQKDGFAGARVDTNDPLALFSYQLATPTKQSNEPIGIETLDGLKAVSSPIQGTIIAIQCGVGEQVRYGETVVIVEAMKMEHVITATCDGVIRQVTMELGSVVREGHPILLVEEGEVAEIEAVQEQQLDLNHIRPDLQENFDRHAYTLDENRQEAVDKRRARGGRMPRENIVELMDEGSFKEYWPLVVARQHQRHDMDTLRKKTPTDGLIAGTGTINADLFSEEDSSAMVVHYDYTVLAGTQGGRGHYKQDRMFELALRFNLPLVLFSEGGGGRPGEDNLGPWVSFDTHTFTQFSKLSGAVPLIGVNHGRCFAGNTVLLACCDVIIATKDSTIGMGGPAMIEGGGLGIYTPEEVGPMSFQVPNGVVDIVVEDEKEAVVIAKKYLSYFQGAIDSWEAPEQINLRHVIPENRLRLYDMRDIISTIADIGSVLEIREKFGVGIITAFIRVEGKPMGVLANNPHHLAGAVDSDGADKGARFMKLCDAFDIPILSLMDCPGLMVGPEVEMTALVRHSARMFNTGANITTPLFGVVVRKAYGLGIQAMCGGSSLVGLMTVAWPTAEFAAMNIEGSVKLGYRNELMAIEDPDERNRVFNEKVDEQYELAKAVNAAVGGGLDDVIDPAETRSWIAEGLKRLPPTPPRTTKKHAYIDTW